MCFLRKGELGNYEFSLSIKTYVSPKHIKPEMRFLYGDVTTIWCNKTFQGINTTNALAYIQGNKGMHI